MQDFPLAGWAGMIFAAMVIAAVAVWFVRRISSDHLMRCPETGGVAVVDVNLVQSANEEVPGGVVQQCDLWPERKDCAQGCLVRQSETAPGIPLDLQVLRPFERP